MPGSVLGGFMQKLKAVELQIRFNSILSVWNYPAAITSHKKGH